MQIKDLIEGTFLERPNRFTVVFKSNNQESMIESAHLRDPGRLKELLYPEARLLLRKATLNPKRKTKFDVIAVFKDNLWVLINSGFHSDLAQELIESTMVSEFEGYEVERREFTFGKSRLDFLLRPLENSSTQPQKMLVEVKGCTLVEDGLARFPDAPTVRGKKHVEELISAKSQGYESSVLFLVLKEDARLFSPNYDTDPDFSRVLEESSSKNVNLIPFVFKTSLNDEILSIIPLTKIKVEFKD